MDKIFSGKVWTFGNDIDTDTIIPGKRGTIPTIEEMKKYAFELLKPEFGSTVQPGDILVAGTNFGCGSSREQAATVLSHNGVRCIIAKSFARIFFRNAFNSGILLLTCDGIQDVVTGGDIVTVDVDNHTVSANGKTFTVGAVPENLNALEQSAADCNAALTGVVGAVQDRMSAAAKDYLFTNIRRVVTGKITPEKAIEAALKLNG